MLELGPHEHMEKEGKFLWTCSARPCGSLQDAPFGLSSLLLSN